MKLLLDTHVLIWWDAGQRLSPAANKAIRDADEVFVSSASAWEVAIKTSLGKITSKRSVAVAARESGFDELAVTMAHSEQVALLPMHHRDPFDRMLVAQAMLEGCVIVTRDDALAKYGVKVVRA